MADGEGGEVGSGAVGTVTASPAAGGGLESEISGGAAPSGAPGASRTAASPRSYSQAEVESMMQGRVNEIQSQWAPFGKREDVMKNMQELSQWRSYGQALRRQQEAASQTASQPSYSPEQKQIRDFMSANIPGVYDMGGRIGKLEKLLNDFQRTQFQRSLALAVRPQLRAQLAAAKIPEAYYDMAEREIAGAIQGNREDSARFASEMDPGIVKKYADSFLTGITQLMAAMQGAAAPGATAGKVQALPPKPGSKGGGTPGTVPTGKVGVASKQSLSGKDRSAAAFDFFTKLSAE